MSFDWIKESEPRRLGTIYRSQRPSIEVFEVKLRCQSTGEHATLIKVQENKANGGWFGVSLPREHWNDVWRILGFQSEDAPRLPPIPPSRASLDGSGGAVVERSVEVEAFDVLGHGA